VLKRLGDVFAFAWLIAAAVWFFTGGAASLVKANTNPQRQVLTPRFDPASNTLISATVTQRPAQLDLRAPLEGLPVETWKGAWSWLKPFYSAGPWRLKLSVYSRTLIGGQGEPVALEVSFVGGRLETVGLERRLFGAVGVPDSAGTMKYIEAMLALNAAVPEGVRRLKLMLLTSGQRFEDVVVSGYVVVCDLVPSSGLWQGRGFRQEVEWQRLKKSADSMRGSVLDSVGCVLGRP
jgi:hypothetical protein